MTVRDEEIAVTVPYHTHAVGFESQDETRGGNEDQRDGC